MSPKPKLLLGRRTRELTRAAAELLASPDVSLAEKELLGVVSCRVHRRDTMYEGAEHYLGVGLSAVRCIRATTPTGLRPQVVLDFGSGYGRVLRFLRALYPSALLVASEIDRRALRFCGRAFGATVYPSVSALSELDLPHRFDLIWCGSVLTHLDRRGATELLRFFRRHLAEGGLCVASAHGRVTEEALRSGETYGLRPSAATAILDGLVSDGYGYADYEGARGYGVSLASPETLVAMATSVGLLPVHHLPVAWDDHHDVYAFGEEA